ncbi:MAG: MBL fold metallo-hydrolase [Cellvibrionales bacterium]|nr:MBL fold metallo-hydrolase [Cellvibrionales bacterium]
MPLFYPGDMGLSQSGAEVTVLDVGQGLAVIVRTARHVLVYDTGDRRSDRFDAGRDIVAPALRNLRVDKIDMLMVSHSDSDHAAGRTGLLNEFSARQLWSGTPEQLSGPESFLPCREGMQWRWDGVIFKVLSPDNATYASDNNRGCVVLVDAGKNAYC